MIGPDPYPPNELHDHRPPSTIDIFGLSKAKACQGSKVWALRDRSSGDRVRGWAQRVRRKQRSPSSSKRSCVNELVGHGRIRKRLDRRRKDIEMFRKWRRELGRKGPGEALSLVYTHKMVKNTLVKLLLTSEYVWFWTSENAFYELPLIAHCANLILIEIEDVLFFGFNQL